MADLVVTHIPRSISFKIVRMLAILMLTKSALLNSKIMSNICNCLI